MCVCVSVCVYTVEGEIVYLDGIILAQVIIAMDPDPKDNNRVRKWRGHYSKRKKCHRAANLKNKKRCVDGR